MSAIQYPNDRTNPAGAIPVYIEAGPVGKAIPVVFEAPPTTPNAGPIPVRVVAAPGTLHGSDQGIDANAIPVYASVSPKAMPVWRIN
jgi:hypothetical protein